MAPAFAPAARVLEPGMRLIKLEFAERTGRCRPPQNSGHSDHSALANGRELARISGAMNATAVISGRENMPARSWHVDDNPSDRKARGEMPMRRCDPGQREIELDHG
jgi:hypothetical protein